MSADNHIITIEAKKEAAHVLPFDELYSTWGSAGYSTTQEAQSRGAYAVNAVPVPLLELAQSQLNNALPSNILSDYHLVHAGLVKYYEGPNHPLLNVIWLRYERTDGVDSGLGGQHVSAVITENGRLLGLSRMQSQYCGGLSVDHHGALDAALSFLSANASDLVNRYQSVQINSNEPLVLGEHIACFDSSSALGVNVSDSLRLLWIADHPELFHAPSGSPIEQDPTHGMKVKMQFVDGSERYAWVIVGEDSSIHVMERNIYWSQGDASLAPHRVTQMWLHDGWLQTHGVTLMEGALTRPVQTRRALD